MPIISVSHIIIIIQFDEEDTSILPYHDVFYVVLSNKTKNYMQEQSLSLL